MVLMEVSLSFLFHKFATASHTAILLRNHLLCVFVCVCEHTCVWVSFAGCGHVCAI